jgi:hypothetical protein
MRGRVVEHEFQPTGQDHTLRLRVDLHGVSVFGPGDSRTLIRWEWIQEVQAGEGATVRSAGAEINFPDGAFGLPPERLATLIREARSLDRRVDVILELGSRVRPHP